MPSPYSSIPREKTAELCSFEWIWVEWSECVWSDQFLKNRKFLEAIASHLNLWNLPNLVVLNLSLFRATRIRCGVWILSVILSCCFDGLWIVYLSVCLFSWHFVSFCLLVKIINLLSISVYVHAWHGLWIVTHSPTRWHVGEWQRVVVTYSTMEVLARQRQRCANAGSVLLVWTDIGTA